MNCPLCQQELLTTDMMKNGRSTYYCSQKVTFSFNQSRHHYSRLPVGNDTHEVSIVLPFRLSSYFIDDKDNRYSNIHVLKENSEFYSNMMEQHESKFEMIARLSYIHLDTEERLRERLQLLMIFS